MRHLLAPLAHAVQERPNIIAVLASTTRLLALLLEELGQIQSADVVVPTIDGRELRLRCVVRPDHSQVALLERLGLELPKRLRSPKGLTGPV
jgi:hypothetical protein